ncbi:MAG: N-acetylglucosamine-6-phosphate deacetylase [Planctomycetes bacterium]|nr:N-acetylglucosamine-6-phosphate deacetylase [Planctomycetota bacterium]
MTEVVGRLLIGGRLAPGRLTLADGRIQQIELVAFERSPNELDVVAPGLIDLHVHGFGGGDPVEQLALMASALARAGTTAFQPTMFPAQPAQLGELCQRTWHESQRLPRATARVVGLHLEGPFVNPERAGALPPEDLATPSPAALRELLGPATGAGRGIKTVTLAPELPGSADLIAELVRCGIRVSLGHSKATAADARAAAKAGAVGATHLFNAMNPVHHREVGLAGFALIERALTAELIGDLVHVGADAVELALAARGPRGLALVSDALRGAGTGCDVFHSHGRAHVIRDGTAYYPPGAERPEPQLAGTAMGQLEMVRRLVARGVVGLEEALTMASETPARALGLHGELGVLAPGARADLIVLRGAELSLTAVYIGGQRLPPVAAA